MADKRRRRVPTSEFEKIEDTVVRLTNIFTKTFKVSSCLSPTSLGSKDNVDELVFEIVHGAAKDVTELRNSIRQWEQEENAKLGRALDESAAKTRLCQKLDSYLNTFFAERRASGDGLWKDFENKSANEKVSAQSGDGILTKKKKKKKKKAQKKLDEEVDTPMPTMTLLWDPTLNEEKDKDIWEELSSVKAADQCCGDTGDHISDPEEDNDQVGLTINLVMRNFFCSLSDEQIRKMGNGIGSILVREQLIDMCMEMLDTSTKAFSVCQSK